MRIAMIGGDYVGLVTGACPADFGHTFTSVDLDAKNIGPLRDGQIPIAKPGLDALIADNAKSDRLTLTTNLAPAVANADVVFIGIGTPTRRCDGHADLSYIYAAAADVARALEDFTRRGRIIIGLEDERVRAVMTEVYGPLYLNRAPLIFTGQRTANLIKYASNAFLAMKLTFTNDIANVCERIVATVEDVALGMGRQDITAASSFVRGKSKPQRHWADTIQGMGL